MANATPMSRRSLLAISAAAVAGTAAVGTAGALAQAGPQMAVGPDPDAALIDLCAQWEALRLDYDATGHAFEVAEAAAVEKYLHLGMPALWAEVHRDPAYREADERSSDIVSRMHTLYQAIGQTWAVTMKAIMAKARITASECFEDGGIEVEADQYTEGVTPHYMALALVRDLLRINGGQA